MPALRITDPNSLNAKRAEADGLFNTFTKNNSISKKDFGRLLSAYSFLAIRESLAHDFRRAWSDWFQVASAKYVQGKTNNLEMGYSEYCMARALELEENWPNAKVHMEKAKEKFKAAGKKNLASIAQAKAEDFRKIIYNEAKFSSSHP